MPPLVPVSRNDLIRGLRQFGFSGPFSGGRHQFMTKDNLRIRMPGPHGADISVNLLARILVQAGIDAYAWLDR